MKHFTYLASSNAPANKLQREALAFLQSKSNLLITDVDAFVKDLKNEIDVLNLENPKCRPLTPSSYNAGSSTGFYLGGTYTVSFHIYPVKKEISNA